MGFFFMGNGRKKAIWMQTTPAAASLTLTALPHFWPISCTSSPCCLHRRGMREASNANEQLLKPNNASYSHFSLECIFLGSSDSSFSFKGFKFWQVRLNTLLFYFPLFISHLSFVLWLITRKLMALLQAINQDFCKKKKKKRKKDWCLFFFQNLSFIKSCVLLCKQSSKSSQLCGLYMITLILIDCIFNHKSSEWFTNSGDVLFPKWAWKLTFTWETYFWVLTYSLLYQPVLPSSCQVLSSSDINHSACRGWGGGGGWGGKSGCSCAPILDTSQST